MRALKLLKMGKAPGPDGYTLSYYKTFAEKLAPRFIAAYNSVCEGKRILTETLLAHITVIPKEGKDPSQCPSYRPISLLNVNLKVFTKILAMRLVDYISGLIHPDQVGFTPEREGRENTQRVVNTIYLAQRQQRPMVIVSADTEKAFDRVDWIFFKGGTTTHRSRRWDAEMDFQFILNTKHQGKDRQ